MITLDEYKKHLVGVYKYEIDNTKAKIYNRKDILGKTLNDFQLQRIINDTYDFIKDVLSCDTINRDYCKFELEDDTTSYIYLNLVGGYNSDTLYKDFKNRTISKYIVKHVLGDRLYIGIEEEEIERIDDDLIYFDYRYYLYMQGFPDDIDDLKNKLFGKTKSLTLEDRK
ncbi:MAG: hypothetical protein IKR57_02780 [Bacilli bacterium]|nr:hypothetical protein [Bacilli bacterium]